MTITASSMARSPTAAAIGSALAGGESGSAVPANARKLEDDTVRALEDGTTRVTEG